MGSDSLLRLVAMQLLLGALCVFQVSAFNLTTNFSWRNVTSSATIFGLKQCTSTLSHTRSLDPPKSPCSNLDVVIASSIYYPMNIEPSKEIVLEAPIVAGTGYKIYVNVTSCHQFDEKQFAEEFRYNATTRRSIIDALDPSASGSGTTNIYGFLSIMRTDPTFVRTKILSGKVVDVSIGPHPDYGIYGKNERVYLVVDHTSFDPPAHSDLFVPIIIGPLATKFGGADPSAAEKGSFFLSVIALAMSNPSTAALVGRVDMLANAMTCPNYLDDEELPFDQNPLNAGFGTEKKLYYHVGATLVNPALFLMCLTIHFSVALFIRSWGSLFGGKYGKFRNVLPLIHFPSFSLAFGVFMFQGTVESSSAVFLNSNAIFFSFAAAYVILLSIAIPVAVWFRVTSRQFHAMRACAELLSTNPKWYVRHLVGVAEWIDRGRAHIGFVAQYGTLFDEYLPRRQWFFVVECMVIISFGFLDASSPKTRSGCLIASACETIILWIYVILLVGLHPYSLTVTHITLVLTAASQLLSSLLTTLKHITSSQRYSSLVNLAGTFLIISVFITMIKTVADLGRMVYLYRHGDERDENIRRWKDEQKRKVRVAKLRKRRVKRIQAVLDKEEEEEEEGKTEGKVDLLSLNANDNKSDGASPKEKKDENKKSVDVGIENDYDAFNYDDEDEVSDESIDIEDFNERDPKTVVSPVPPITECPPAEQNEEESLLRTCGMRKSEIWRLL